MSEQDHDGRAVQDAERARLDEGLCALGFPAGGGRRGGGFRLKAAVREARADRSFDFGEEWQRNREEAAGSGSAEPTPRRAAAARGSEPKLLSFTPRAAGATEPAGEPEGPTSSQQPPVRAEGPALDDRGIVSLLGYLERRDERIFGLLERLALGGTPALPAPAPRPEPEAAQARPAAPDANDLADRLSRIEAALAALVPAAADPEPEPAGGDD